MLPSPCSDHWNWPTPTAKSAWRGTPKNPSAASTTSTAPNSPAPNSANWEDLRDADRPPGLRRLGRTRSPSSTGTTPASPTAQPERSTL